MKNKYRNFNFSLILALVLSFCGGALEAYSLTNRGAFALMQTGNIINVFITLVKGDWSNLLVSLIVIITFIFGLFISNLIEYFCAKKEIRYQPIELVLATILLVAVIFIPANYLIEDTAIVEGNRLDAFNIGANVLLALIGAMFLESFRKMNDKNFTSTMMTANLQRMVSSFFKGEEKHDQKELLNGVDYIFVILSFGLGVIWSFGYFYLLKDYFLSGSDYWIKILPNLSLLFVVLLIILLLLFRKIYLARRKVNLTIEEEIKE